jgi:hypothetical protein
LRSFFVLVMVASFYPWIRAWLAVGKSSLAHALAWTCAAWIGCTLLLGDPEVGVPGRYLALSLIACAGVAVLGARRPHVAAWNFVVAGQLAVLALPLLENLVLSEHSLGPVRLIFLAATLLVVLCNYLPTSFGPAAFLASLACAGEMWTLLAGMDTPRAVTLCSPMGLALVPWAGWACWIWRRQPRCELGSRWLSFRDCFGVMWSLRVREQFNHAAEHAGWPVLLAWNGVVPRNLNEQPKTSETEMLADFQALIKRFSDCGHPSKI